MQTSNPTWQRRNNLAVLARAVWQNPGASRRDLDRRFQIDKSSISRLVQVLIDLGLVETAGRSDAGLAQGGRPRVALRVRAEYGQVWGLALWPDKARLTILNARGEVLATRERLFGAFVSWDQYLAQALDFASAVAEPLGFPLLGLGLAVPGLVDFSQGTIVRSLPFGLQNFRPGVPDRLPVLWENDANCGAWSCQSPGADLGDALYVFGRSLDPRASGVTGDLSVGYGLVIGGRLHRGWRHRAGEFRSALWRPGMTAQLSANDDPARELAGNLRSAAELLDPQTIFLGGDLKFAHAELRRAMDAIGWDAEALMKPLPAEADEVSLGAAQLVLDELFQIPSPDASRGPTPGRSLFRNFGGDAGDPLWRGLAPLDWPSALERLPTAGGGAIFGPTPPPRSTP